MLPVNGLQELRAQGRMTWIEAGHGWVAPLEDILTALTNDGFEECKRAMTTSRRDGQPAGGLWQGINPHTGSVASTIWVNRSTEPGTLVFITIDGHTFRGASAGATEGDPYREDGGEA